MTALLLNPSPAQPAPSATRIYRLDVYGLDLSEREHEVLEQIAQVEVICTEEVLDDLKAVIALVFPEAQHIDVIDLSAEDDEF